MGIQGLRTFVSRNHDRLVEERHLYGTKLVIDGNNLIHNLYHSAGLECAYGGDYDRYAMEIRHYFGLFKACSVEAIVVFDGGHDVSDRKLETRLQSMRDRLSTASEVARTGQNNKILPCLANAVFKDVIRQLGVRMLQCRFEADEEIAAIANHFGCPVASQDSDFYIFDVSGGFIRLDSIAKAPSTTSIGGVEVKSLFCQLYHVRNLLILFPGLDPQLLPLFPSVVGNDYVSRNTFDAFLSGLKPPEIECSTMPSSYACSLPLRKVLFGLALGPEEESNVTVEVFERDGEDLTRRLPSQPGLP
ncbi:hypothetical protein ISCGN_016264 [Ixodes scapularis]